MILHDQQNRRPGKQDTACPQHRQNIKYSDPQSNEHRIGNSHDQKPQAQFPEGYQEQKAVGAQIDEKHILHIRLCLTHQPFLSRRKESAEKGNDPVIVAGKKEGRHYSDHQSDHKSGHLAEPAGYKLHYQHRKTGNIASQIPGHLFKGILYGLGDSRRHGGHGLIQIVGYGLEHRHDGGVIQVGNPPDQTFQTVQKFHSCPRCQKEQDPIENHAGNDGRRFLTFS